MDDRGDRRPALVLVAEDDADLAREVTNSLTAAGYAVVAVRDGVSALHAARSTRPAALVLDLALPVLDGRRVAQRMGQDPDLRRVPVVVATGLQLSIAEREALCVPNPQVGTILHKPYAEGELLAAVAAAIGRGWGRWG